MAQFTIALASEFNDVRNTVINVLGTGSGTRGYGSPTVSSAVSVGQQITPTEFTSLTTDINACYRHITNANATTLASIVQGGTVTWANFLTYQQAATFIDNNRDTNGGAVTTPAAAEVILAAGWGNASTNRRATRTGTFTWASAADMRYFFNQGCNLRLTGSATAGGTPPKDAAFAALCNGVNLSYTAANYRAASGTSQTQLTSVSPYSTGANPSGMTVSFSAPGASSIGFSIVCYDTGSDDGDANGVIVESNVGRDLGFYANIQNVSNTVGITQYIPSATYDGAWVYATS